MYRHILIATDGSSLAEKAVSHGLSLAKSVGAKVTALIVAAPFNVYDVPERGYGRCRKPLHSMPSKSGDTGLQYWIVSRKRQERLASLARQCRSSMTNLIRRSSRPQRREAAMSLSWPRTDVAGFLRFCSGA
jgi:Universal stress protein family